MAPVDQELLVIRSENVPVLEGLADFAGTDPETYLIQALTLGVGLARIQIESRKLEDDVFILFEQSEEEKVFSQLKIDFTTEHQEEPEQTDIDLDVLNGLEASLEMVKSSPEDDLVLEFEANLIRAAKQTAKDIGVEYADFIDECIYWRHEWAHTRNIGKLILIRVGEEGRGRVFHAEFEEAA